MVDFRKLREKDIARRQGLLVEPEKKSRWPGRHAIAATGHRPNKLFGYDLRHHGWLTLGRLMREFLLEKLDEHGSLACISGMALGVDQLYALVALKLRNEGHDVHVVAALPCRGQNSKWRSDEYWRDIMERADERFYVLDGPYTPTCMNERNVWMVDNADEMLAVWDGSSGGTGNCVRDARFFNRPISNLYDALQDALREEGPKP